MKLLRALALAAFWVVATVAACSDGGEPEVQRPQGDAGGAGGSGGGGKPDGGDPDAASDAGGDVPEADAALSPLRLGIIPVPPHGADAGPSPADEKLALLDVIALGSRGVSRVERWKQLFPTPGAPAAAEWTKLGGLKQLYQGSERKLLVCLALVTGTQDARPSGLPPGWNETETRGALEALVDKVFDTFGDELQALSFGNELDRFLSTQSAKDAADLAALVEHGLDYARQHPKRPAALLLGATFSADALVKGPPPLVAKLLGKSDVAVATYYPLDAAFKARSPTTVAQELDALTGSVSGDGGADAEAGAALPVLLQEVGYPSAAENGSSPEQQRAFYQGLFQALASRRERFPFVSVNGFHDAEPARCADEAVSLGAPGSGVAIAARCSLGLRQADQTAKPAFSAVLDALAQYSTP